MQPNVIQLKSIIKNKAAIFRELKKYIKPIDEIAKDAGLAIYKQEQEHLILKEHLFGKETGLLPLVERLIEINALLVSYEKPTYLGTAAMNHYDEMLKRVEKEQDFLINHFRKTLREVILHKRYKEYWDESFPIYRIFLNTLKLDLTYFNLALKTYAKWAIHWIVNLLNKEQIDEAIYFLKKEEVKILSEKEFNFFKKLLEMIKYEKYEEADKVLGEEKEFLEEDEFKLLTYVLNRFKSKKESEKQLEIPLEQIAEKLELEEEELELYEEVAREAVPEVTPQIKEKAEEIEEIIELVDIVKVGRIKIKKPKESKLKKLKEKFKQKIKSKKINKRELLNKGLKVLSESTNLKNKVVELIKLRLLKSKNEIEILEQNVYGVINGALDLKPVKIKGRRIWVPIKDETSVFLEKEWNNVKQLEQNIGRTISAFTSEQYKKSKEFKKRATAYAVSLLKGIGNYKTLLREKLAKINIKRKSKKFLISAMLVPLLISAFPSKIDRGKITSTLGKPKALTEIIEQLKLDIQDPATQKMFETSAFVDVLINIIKKNKIGTVGNKDLPDYIKELVSDGILDIALFVGAEFEHVPIKKDEIRIIPENMLVLRIRYVDNIKDAKKALEECDIIHVESHSRFGLGWALAKEGMANPLRMQPSPIKIPKKELHGYKGPILKDLGKEVIIQTSDEDIKKISPRKGYQLISMNTCDSGKHFLEVIRRLRQGLPTTVIYAKSDVESENFEIMVKGVLSGKSIENITEEMNEYERRVKLKKKEPIRFENPFEAVVLNTEVGSVESVAYDKYNIPNSLILFYDVESQPSLVQETDLKFSPTSIPEVNKTIYTEGSYKNSPYVVIIPHSTELNALIAGKAVAKGPITYVDSITKMKGNDNRYLIIKTVEGDFKIDPNNAFCNPGVIECFKFLNGKNLNSFKKETQAYVINSITRFTDEISSRIFVDKMVLALHQNTKNNWGIRSYKYDPEYSKYAAEVFVNPDESNDVVAYVNTKGWFEVLKAKGWNVVLQNNDPSLDDGSISYAATLRRLPYVNIEVEIGDAKKQVQMIETLNELLEKYPKLATDMNFVPP